MTNKIKKITADFIVQNGMIEYLDDITERIKPIREHERQRGLATYEIVDRVQYYQHKYYRGFVLPAIAEAQGEADLSFCHLQLKREFLFLSVTDIKDVLPRLLKGCVMIMDGDKITGIIPSTAALTSDEMSHFIVQCEQVRDGLIDWSISTDAIEARRRAGL